MKVLLLSCNTGGGHNSAAKALSEELSRRNISNEVADALSFASDRVSKNISEVYNKMAVYAPKVFYAIYTAGDAISTNRFKSVVYRINSLYKRNLMKHINDNGYDCVMCTHLFPAQTITELTRKKLIDVVSFAICTDYTCIPFWEDLEPTYSIIAHPLLREEFAKRKVRLDNIYSLGIPVGLRFAIKNDKRAAKDYLSLPQDKKTVVVMSGSMGAGKLDGLTDKLLERYGDGISVVIMGGNNEKLKNALRARYAARGNVNVLDFINEVDLYMDAADVVITKPGGLSSTEAAAKRVPLILSDPIPGCESKNAELFSKLGLAYCANGSEQQFEYCCMLLDDEQRCDVMRRAQEEYINNKAASDICDLLGERV